LLFSKLRDCVQARLYEIVTSEKGLPEPAKPETPWMVDGGGLPPNPLNLIKELVSDSNSCKMSAVVNLCIKLLLEWGLVV
jgi:hypothetical protein